MEQIYALQAPSVEQEIRTDSVRVSVLISSFRNAIRDVFGPTSPEFQEFGHIDMLRGPLRVGMPKSEIIEAKIKGRDYMVAVCGELIQRLQRKLRVTQHSDGSTGNSDNWHPKIATAAAELWANGHHWEAVFAAGKALVLHVKERSGRHDLDGAPLMRTVFSKNSPVLCFNALTNATDSDEQEGMMHLFEGAVMALRNPGGHAFPTGTEARARQYIELLSMLAERTDEAQPKS
jgi:uncharacterized protein (TIGR02391 family)